MTAAELLAAFHQSVSEDPTGYAYLFGVLLLGLLAALRVHLWLNQSERYRSRRLERVRSFFAIATGGPAPDADEVAREMALDSVEQHSSVLRGTLVPLILLLTFLLASIPFLNHVPAATVSLVVGAITVVLGIAARPFVENAIAGVVLAASRMIRIGDTIRIDDYYGTIEDIGIVHTTLKVWDWRRYVIPNTRMLSSEFLNYTLNDKFMWVWVEFTVAPDSDMDAVQEVAVGAADASKWFARHEDPSFWIMGIEKEGVRCWLAAWADDPAKGWELGADIRSAMVRGFQERGIHTHSYRHQVGGAPGAGAGPFGEARPPEAPHASGPIE